MKRPFSIAEPAEAGRAFPVPADAPAWWAFAGSSLGGLLLLKGQAPHRFSEGLLLLFSLFCLFMASDWISSLNGKSHRGEVPKGSPASLPGITLLMLGLGSLALFLHQRTPLESRFWVALLACAAGLTALMFLLRLELLPFDRRLIALSSLLCTLPALFLALLALGHKNPGAWAFWMAPALFYPASSVFSWTWLQGLYHARMHLALLAAPLMLLIAAALTVSADLAALTLTAYLIYMMRRLLQRYRLGPERLPEFSDIRRLGREQLFWNSVVLASWLLSGVLI